MAVVINEFETVAAAPPPQRGAESDTGGGGGGSSEPSEHEIEKLVEMRASRSERIRAY
jgi:hypothetical protein